ncbi:MAG: hypothetical protein JW804_08595 [Sedimentisphaerales bacterium]|nr:hypothetical protein [Sedimentisphaerales bacterium]
MTQYSINKTIDRFTNLTDNCIAVMRMFGLTKERLYRIQFHCDCTIEIAFGNIIYITGPSGSGKTIILNELKKAITKSNQTCLNTVKMTKDKAVIDCFDTGLSEALKYLSTAGLADYPSLLNTPANLSEGQQWRLRLAIALSKQKPFIFADEFCSVLDRITASCIAHNIRKFADRYKVTFILASAHQDILADLLPDAIVTRDMSNNTEITYKTINSKA